MSGPNSQNVTGPFDWTFVFDYGPPARARFYANAQVDRSDNPDIDPNCPRTTVTTLLGDAQILTSRVTPEPLHARIEGSFKTGVCTNMSITFLVDGGGTITLTGPLRQDELWIHDDSAGTVFAVWDPAVQDVVNAYGSHPGGDAANLFSGRWVTNNQAIGGFFHVRDRLFSYHPDTWLRFSVDNRTSMQFDSAHLAVLGHARLYDTTPAFNNLPGNFEVHGGLRRVDSAQAVLGGTAKGPLPYQFDFYRNGQIQSSARCTISAETPDSVVVRVLTTGPFGAVCDRWQPATTTPRTVFFDDFNSGDTSLWSATEIITPQAIPSISQGWYNPIVGGNPGGFRRMVHHFTAATAPDFYTIAVYHLFNAAYNPATDGSLQSIVYTEDRRRISANGDVGTAALIYQGNVYHVALLSNGVFNNPDWQTLTVTLHASDFLPPVDFSAGGGPMKFGYVRSNSSRFPIDIEHGIDNWGVRVVR